MVDTLFCVATDFRVLGLDAAMLYVRKQKSGRRGERGNLVLITGLIAVPLAMTVAITVEMVALTNEKARMQAAVDAAALAGAREMAISGGGARNANRFAETFAFNQVADLSPRVSMSFTASQLPDGGFEVAGVGVRGSFFGNLVPPGGFKIRVSALADALNQQPLCILTLPPTPSRIGVSLTASLNSNIKAANCLVHSNSTLVTTNNAVITAGTIQTTGSATGTGFSPAANSGAIGVLDPFAARRIKRRGVCAPINPNPLKVGGNTLAFLAAGVLRRELIVGGNATLILLPGEHYFCNGVSIEGNATLKGNNVVMIFEGPKTFKAGPDSGLSLDGRQTGDWAGFLLVTDRDNTTDVVISSKLADKLLGTIYLPSAKLIIDSAGQVAQGSKWSVVVAQDMFLNKSAALVINSDYAGSGVPVPVGVGDKLANAKSGNRLRK